MGAETAIAIQSRAVEPIVIAVEPFAAAYAEAGPLPALHWSEIAKNKELLTLNPDIEQYLSISDKLLLVTARAGGKLVGYFLWVMITHPHYRHVTVAEEDLHFLLPEYRRGLAGYMFVKQACQAAMDRGAQILTMREKVGHEHVALMKRLGFKPTDIVYTRVTTGDA